MWRGGREDCGCHTGGGPGWNQRWRTPLREAFDRLRNHGAEVFERRGAEVLRRPVGARDEYVSVVLGATTVEDFAARWVKGDSDEALVQALTLLEAQRHLMLMYTSCGWFFNDVAGLETVQVMRYAARAADLLDEVGEPLRRRNELLDVLSNAREQRSRGGDGRDIWLRHVEPSRVDAARVVAHLAMIDLLERRDPPAELGGYHVHVHRHDRGDRGSVEMCCGRVELRHRRTRPSPRAHLRRAADGCARDRGREPARPAATSPTTTPCSRASPTAFRDGERVTALVRRMIDELAPADLGGEEFSLDSALPDAAEQVLRSTAQSLVDRFDVAFERLVTDAADVFEALALASYPLPPELKLPVEMATARRLEADLVALAGGLRAGDAP